VAKIFLDAKLPRRNRNHSFDYEDWHHLMKGAIMNIWWKSYHAAGTPWRWPSLNSPEDFKMKIFLALASNLTWLCSHYKYQVLMPLQPESDPELNIKNIEKFLIFLIVICTLQYNKRSRSYDFLKLTELLKPCSGQNWLSREISAFDPTLNVTSGNIPY
jgi:hypothetical protein